MHHACSYFPAEMSYPSIASCKRRATDTVVMAMPARRNKFAEDRPGEIGPGNVPVPRELFIISRLNRDRFIIYLYNLNSNL